MYVCMYVCMYACVGEEAALSVMSLSALTRYVCMYVCMHVLVRRQP
jgi:hypothetical protein